MIDGTIQFQTTCSFAGATTQPYPRKKGTSATPFRFPFLVVFVFFCGDFMASGALINDIRIDRPSLKRSIVYSTYAQS